MADNLRIPPQNIDSEKALLGSVMLNPEMMHDISDTVTPESFYVEKHKIIFESIFHLFAKHNPIDLLSVSTRLKTQNKLDQIGGNSYLTELTNTVPTAANAKYYADLVQKAFTLRCLINASEYINSLGYEEGDELEETLDKAEKKIYDVTNATTTHKFTSISESLTEAWDRLDRLHKSDSEIRGTQTGFKEFDNILAGFQPSDLIILAARPSVGKTSLALDIARQTAVQHNTPVGFFSLEMSSQQLVDRMLAAEARVDAWKLRTGKLNQDAEFDRLRDAMDRLSNAPIYIDDQPGTNIMKMRSIARRLKREHGLGLIVVDYLQLMMPSTTKAADSMTQQITEISRSLKILAKELDVPVLALSQLSRAVEQRGGKPRLSDLRDSGSIEQDADVVMFIHRDDRVNENSDRPNIAEILIEKHRNGATGKVDLYFDEKKATFLSLEKSDFSAFENSEAEVEDF